MRTHSPESRSFAERVQLVMDLTSRLNVLPFGDIETRNALLSEILEDRFPPRSPYIRLSTATPTQPGIQRSSPALRPDEGRRLPGLCLAPPIR